MSQALGLSPSTGKNKKSKGTLLAQVGTINICLTERMKLMMLKSYLCHK
jgi:hypothetical protein